MADDAGRAMSNVIPGLTSAEVALRVARGQVNLVPRSEWRAYAGIVSRNICTLFNALVLPAAIALFFLQKYQGALAVSAMAVVNSALGLYQEIRAKRHLDRLAILVETKVRVRRDSQDRTIAAHEVVLDDLVLLAAGETVVADGTVIDARFLEVDEALLTGESDPVRRQHGDQLLSGSFCVAGEGIYRADKVGAEAFANRTSLEARSYRFTPSPLTRTINLLIHILTYTAVGLCILYAGLFWLGTTSEEELVQNMAATITSMVPQGLVLTATVSFTLAAVLMSTRGAVVQRLSAVESMAAIDVICTDKTGTLTTNQLRLDQVRRVGMADESEGRRMLGLFAAASLDRGNKTIRAITAAIRVSAVQPLDVLPFKSQNRYSGVRILDGAGERVLVLGAAEALRPYLDPQADRHWEQIYAELLSSGLRLLLFTEADRCRPFDHTLEGFQLRPLLLVALSDELRPDVDAVLQALHAQGIGFKIVSGDNPETVRATVSRLQVALAADAVVTGEELAASTDAQSLIADRGIFGRVAPLQKVQIVQTLQQLGRHVAMIGDGVNDVLPIKKADLGIAMGEGSQASKTVAGLVLESNAFALLPETLEEGRTIIRNLRRSAKLFLVKNVYSLLLILAYASGLFGVPFPYEPQQVTLLNWLVIGIPAFAIALSRERSRSATRPRFLREVGLFAIRTGVILAAAGMAVLLMAIHVLDCSVKIQRTLLLSVLILLGITVLWRALTDGEPAPLKGDNRFRWLALAAVPAYLACMYLNWPAAFFQLAPLSLTEWLVTLAVVLPAAGLTMLTDKIWGQ
jgi:cation-transporting ATPase E